MAMKVVHCKKDKYDIYIGRTYGAIKDTGWGNPFIIGVDGDRNAVIRKYESYILGNKELLARLPELKDKILGCWCSPLACHGDVLIELCNMEPEKLKYYSEIFGKHPGYTDHPYYNDIVELEKERYKVK